jgi:hypothetical protein
MVRLRILGVLAAVSVAFAVALVVWHGNERERIEALLANERAEFVPVAQ